MSIRNLTDILARKNREAIKYENASDALRQDSETIADGWRQLGLFFTGGGSNFGENFVTVGQGGTTVGP
ncbi:hypothetical protein HN803_07810 [candidate division WWE3 bacterium]|jgi:hypothetical protein|nr:hypothetical protein [candidate division WWE3 bacterium]